MTTTGLRVFPYKGINYEIDVSNSASQIKNQSTNALNIRFGDMKPTSHYYSTYDDPIRKVGTFLMMAPENKEGSRSLTMMLTEQGKKRVLAGYLDRAGTLEATSENAKEILAYLQKRIPELQKEGGEALWSKFIKLVSKIHIV